VQSPEFTLMKERELALSTVEKHLVYDGEKKSTRPRSCRIPVLFTQKSRQKYGNTCTHELVALDSK
jgi:hypothetical protein